MFIPPFITPLLCLISPTPNAPESIFPAQLSFFFLISLFQLFRPSLRIPYLTLLHFAVRTSPHSMHYLVYHDSHSSIVISLLYLISFRLNFLNNSISQPPHKLPEPLIVPRYQFLENSRFLYPMGPFCFIIPSPEICARANGSQSFYF